MTRVADRDWLERLAIAAKAYSVEYPEREQHIDDFLLFVFKNYGYTELLKRFKQ